MGSKAFLLAAVVAAQAGTAHADGEAVQLFTATTEVAACLPIDDAGVTLAATEGGLVLVGADGAPRRVWTALDGLPGTKLSAIAAAADGAFWIGGEDGLVLARIGDDALQIARTFPSKPVRAILVREHDILAATWGGGVVRVADDRLEPIPGMAGARATSLAIWADQVYAGTAGNGLFRLDGDELHHVELKLASDLIWALAAHDGHLTIGTVAGVATLGADGARVTGTADTRALLASEDDHDLMIGTYGPKAYVNGLARAHGVTCIAARDGLAVSSHDRTWRQAQLAVTLPSNDVAAIVTTPDAVWVGTFDHGLVVYRGGCAPRPAQPCEPPHRDHAWSHVEGVDARVNALARDSVDKDRVWVATARGVASTDGHTTRRFDGLPSDDVHALKALKDGGVAVGTARGLVILKDGRAQVIAAKQGLEGDAVWAVEEGEGVLWIGTSRGLYRWDEQKKKMRRFSMATGHLDEDWVTAIVAAGDQVWAGTYSKGVTHLTADARAKRGYRAEFLAGGAVNVGGLAFHDETLYAATMDGLMRFSNGAWIGLPRAAAGKDVTAIAPGELGLWVASRRGVTYVE